MSISPSKKNSLRIFISAGESSGDLLGSSLYEALKKKKENIEAYGITGPAMNESGVNELKSINFFNTMGFTSTLKNLSKFLLFKKKILRKIETLSPDCAILIDNQELHKHLSEDLKMRGIPTVLYVAPQVWAWRVKRAETLHEYYSLVLGLLPFEKKFFQDYPVNYHFVGSDVFERTKFYQKKIFKTRIKRIAFFPGSRLQEIKSILPSMLQIAKEMSSYSYHIVLHLKKKFKIQQFDQITKKAGLFFEFKEMSLKDITYKKNILKISHKKSLKLMSEVDFAFITSGTACLECAFIGTPLIVLYKTNFINYFIAKKFIKILYISLPNLILEKECLKEFIQDLDTKKITQYALKTIRNEKKLNEIKIDFQKLRKYFPENPSERAANLILKLLEKNPELSPPKKIHEDL